ncbi:uncharacterized protein LOC143372355 isoform X1 [Andrena cerasifolii]|uniref:uncharacterized protein LOC143372355 isoform X1 n=1 Tax=Andrena cerasifolii TaxID=2819439 RepID=UPI00403819CC
MFVFELPWNAVTRCSKKRQACPINHAQSDGKRRARKRDSRQLKICTEWTQEWTCAKRLRRNKRLDVREVIRGPFSALKLLRTQPLVAISPCRGENANVANAGFSGERHGIPDAWREYIAMRRFCGATEARATQKGPMPCYVSCIATHVLWTELGLPFVQGIPDPWKSESLLQRRSVRCLCQRRTRRNGTRDACNYDGDDEAETERNVKRRHCDGKKDGAQDGEDDSKLRGVEWRMHQKSEDTLKEVKGSRKKYVDQLPLAGKSRFRSKQRKDGEKGKPVDNEKVKERRTRRKGDPSRVKYDDTRPLQKSPDKGNETTKSVQRSPNVVCCNCPLQNYVSPLQGVDTSNYVLCHRCENARREGTRRVDCSGKKIDVCVPDSNKSIKHKAVACEEICKRTRMQKAKQRLDGLMVKNRVETRSTIVCERDLKFICYHCGSPYLRISSNTIDRKACTAVRNQPDKKSGNEKDVKYNRAANCLSKCPKARRQRNNARCNSTNANCTCRESKRFTSKRDHERSPHSTTIEQRNDAGNKNADEIRTENERGDDAAERKGILGIGGKEMGDTRNASTNVYNSITRKEWRRLKRGSTRRNRFYATNGDLAKGECKETPTINRNRDCVNRTRHNNESEDKEWKVECSVTSTTSDEKAGIRRSKYSRSDKNSKHTISDSGEYADGSDNLANVNISVTDQDRLSVTSITFMSRLNNTLSTKRRYGRRGPRRNRRTPLAKGFRRILGTEDQVAKRSASNKPLKLERTANDRNENFPTEACDTLPRFDFNNSKESGQVENLINTGKNSNTRKTRRSYRPRHRMY